ncbi:MULTISPECIES: hypothetical protein [Nitrosopumilus]|nr:MULTISPECIES: hypothetical protein [Nitrosopumilus]
MDESQISSFVMWSAVTGIIMLVTGLSYRAYVGKKNREISSS